MPRIITDDNAIIVSGGLCHIVCQYCRHEWIFSGVTRVEVIFQVILMILYILLFVN